MGIFSAGINEYSELSEAACGLHNFFCRLISVAPELSPLPLRRIAYEKIQ